MIGDTGGRFKRADACSNIRAGEAGTGALLDAAAGDFEGVDGFFLADLVLAGLGADTEGATLDTGGAEGGALLTGGGAITDPADAAIADAGAVAGKSFFVFGVAFVLLAFLLLLPPPVARFLAGDRGALPRFVAFAAVDAFIIIVADEED